MRPSSPFRIGGLCLFLALPGAAAAGGGGAEVLWQCWYNRLSDTPAVACRLIAIGSTEFVVPDPRLPRFVKQVQEQPGTLRPDELVVIPLHSPPVDMPLMGRLARHVVCGRRTHCRVEMDLGLD